MCPSFFRPEVKSFLGVDKQNIDVNGDPNDDPNDGREGNGSEPMEFGTPEPVSFSTIYLELVSFDYTLVEALMHAVQVGFCDPCSGPMAHVLNHYPYISICCYCGQKYDIEPRSTKLSLCSTEHYSSFILQKKFEC